MEQSRLESAAALTDLHESTRTRADATPNTDDEQAGGEGGDFPEGRGQLSLNLLEIVASLINVAMPPADAPTHTQTLAL